MEWTDKASGDALNALLNDWFTLALTRNDIGPYNETVVPFNTAVLAGRMYKRGLKAICSLAGVETPLPAESNASLIPPLSLMTHAQFLKASPIQETQKRFFIIDHSVSKHWPEWSQGTLSSENSFFLHPSEDTKTLDTVMEIIAAIPEGTTSVFAIGGGITLDIAGFVAALINKPIDSVATTLLSAVDASIGGKTGVNHSLYGKNQLGFFSGARSLTIVPEYFQSLPEVEISCGLAEAIKHSWLFGSFSELHPLFEQVFKNPHDIAALSRLTLINFEYKSSVVLADPREKGLRKILNLGHTLGHLLESLAANNVIRPVPHGLAVALGLQALLASSQLSSAPPELVDFLGRLCSKHGLSLPLSARGSKSEIRNLCATLLQADKKNDKKGSDILFTLPPYGAALLPQSDHLYALSFDKVWNEILPFLISINH